MHSADADEICRLSATEIVGLVRARALSPVEVTDAVLARTAAVDDALGAFCTPTPDLARAAALRVADDVAAGRETGPLAGVPLGVKDLIATKGIRTTSGSHAYADFVPDEDDIVVERVVGAGAIVLGKTNATEFGYSATGHNPLFPPTRNPWDTARTPGGSSAGSAAAVAAGLGPVALGSDGGGSVRVPAALCGIFGFKASMGRVPVYPGCRDERYPGVSGWESVEHIGPLTRTVADAALMLSVLAGPDPRDRHSIPCTDVEWTRRRPAGRLRIAYSPDLGRVAVDPEVRRVVDAAAHVFERDLGAAVDLVDLELPDFSEAFGAIVAAETDLTGMRALADRLGPAMSPHLTALLRAPWTAEQFTDAGLVRKAVANRTARIMSTYDLILTPTAAVPAFPVGIQGPELIDGRMVRTDHWTSFTPLANLTGQPAASLPAGHTRDGLPVGAQLIGRHLGDGQLLDVCAAFEEAAPWRAVWPPLSPSPAGPALAPDSTTDRLSASPAVAS
ncbi:amidase [Streptomyces sp. VRA16 Mangrove soil]|uniref:amidase n=1 Tax=Streptomyces sp. VRA16 Mangrove soil TaxID=2817434 RepID=UPI001A9D8E40|nr:amidase [Streptomyces sp. VRA16 Mangrove soil]MBO1332767.1 amidase [Streptomyces sp. VRA16 Mangrove soil]